MKWPWRDSIIGKFFVSYFGVVLLLFISFFFYSGALLRDFYISSLSRKMQEEAKVLSRLLPQGLEGEALDRICRDLARDLKIRLTVIAGDGKVLGDSEEQSSTMENHATRPEVVQTATAGAGQSIRYSATVGYEMLYQAIQHGGRIIRLSVPLEAVEEVAGAIRRTILFGLLLASASGLALAFVFSRRIGWRVKRVAKFSHDLAQGSLPQELVPIQGKDDLSLLEKNLNEISRSIREKMEEITAEKEKAISILDCMVEGVLVVDTRARMIHLNGSARRMFQLPEGPGLEGAPLVQISRHPEMKKLMEEVLAHDPGASQSFTKELSLDGNRCFQVNAAGLGGGNASLLGFILVFHDVTELRRLEQVRADFVANVSHELRTPLTAIRGYAETLLENPPEDRRDSEQFLGIIHRHSERLGRLIDDLLSLSNLETGNVQLTETEVRLEELVGRVLELFQDRAAKKHLSLSQVVEPGIGGLRADADRLQELLINLVDNGIKYTPSGGEVKVTARQASLPDKPHQPMIDLAVADTGCGIPENELPRLTERFYRVDKARSRELGGTGLGLAIVKHIAQLHNGFLRVESEMNKGTTVHIFLPA